MLFKLILLVIMITGLVSPIIYLYNDVIGGFMIIISLWLFNVLAVLKYLFVKIYEEDQTRKNQKNDYM